MHFLRLDCEPQVDAHVLLLRAPPVGRRPLVVGPRGAGRPSEVAVRRVEPSHVEPSHACCQVFGRLVRQLLGAASLLELPGQPQGVHRRHEGEERERPHNTGWWGRASRSHEQLGQVLEGQCIKRSTPRGWEVCPVAVDEELLDEAIHQWPVQAQEGGQLLRVPLVGIGGW